MPYSPDATQHIKTDPNSRFTVITNQIIVNAMPRNEDAHVQRSYGADFFTDISNGDPVTDANGFQFIADPDGGQNNGGFNVYALANEVNDWRYFYANNLPILNVLMGRTSGGIDVITPFYIKNNDTVVNMPSHINGGAIRYGGLTFGSGNFRVKMWSDITLDTLVYDQSAFDMKVVSFEHEYLTQSDNVPLTAIYSGKSSGWLYTDRDDPFAAAVVPPALFQGAAL